MADSIQAPFERFNITSNDLQQATKDDSSAIPIIQRSIVAKSNSLKLRDISPVCVLVVGMAGSGKTTLMAALQRSLTIPKKHDDGPCDGNEKVADDDIAGNTSANENSTTIEEENKNKNGNGPVGYCLNLDPATKLVPFGASIDIRDTVDYKVSF